MSGAGDVEGTVTQANDARSRGSGARTPHTDKDKRRPIPAKGRNVAAQFAHAPQAASADVDTIHARLQSAILEHRLPPGTKLGEDRLADIFGVSRARVRQLLSRLHHEQLVDIFPQRGAFVACPTPEQARDVFEARRVIEPAIVRRLIEHLAPAKVRQLRAHLAKEVEARRLADARAVIRLSGEFHCLLAELAGNSAFVRSMRELSAITCLIISLYNAPTAESCREDEHACLVDAIERKDIALAQQVVLEHLAHIEGSLVLRDQEDAVDLERILGG